MWAEHDLLKEVGHRAHPDMCSKAPAPIHSKRLDQAQVIIFDIPNPLAHRPALHLLSRDTARGGS
jgi:hypothetical protein